MPLITARPFEDEFSQQNLTPSPSDVRGALFKQGVIEGPISSMDRMRELSYARQNSGYEVVIPEAGEPVKLWEPSRILSKQESADYLKSRGLDGHIPLDHDFNERELSIIADRKKAELFRADILGRAKGGMTGRVATMLASQIVDPLSLGSAFVPVYGEARYAAMLGKAGSMLAKAGVRAQVGAVEGAVGSALLEPLTYLAHKQEYADYTIGESLTNVALGSVMGGALHAGPGAVGDFVRARKTARVVAQEAEISKAVNDKIAWWQERAAAVDAATQLPARTDIESFQRLVTTQDIESSVAKLYQRRRDELEQIATRELPPEREAELRKQADGIRKQLQDAEPEDVMNLDARLEQVRRQIMDHEMSSLAGDELRRLDSAWYRAGNAKDRAAMMSGADSQLWKALDLTEKAEQLEAVQNRIAALEQERAAAENSLAAANQMQPSALDPDSGMRIEGAIRDANREVRKIDDELFQLRPLAADLAKATENAPVVTVYRATSEQRSMAMKAAMAQVASGEPLELRPIFDNSAKTMEAAGKRLSDPDSRDLSNPVAVQAADAVIAKGESLDLSATQKAVADLEMQIKALIEDAEVGGDERVAKMADDLNQQLAEIDKLSNESQKDVALLAACAMRYA